MSAGTAPEPVLHSTSKWLKENEKAFLPPVCNKMIHNYQLKVFYVGGPNQRKDYHLDEGEEFFYMRKGDMCLKVLYNDKFKDIKIREGEVFLLPGRIPHSPQRFENTVGLVVERDRLNFEKDCLRYYVDGSKEILFEKWFKCTDLSTQLPPVINEFFQSEEYKTGKPTKDNIESNPPWVPDSARRLESPFSIKDWVANNFNEIFEKGSLDLWDKSYQSDIIAHGYGSGKKCMVSRGGETLFLSIQGSPVKITIGNHVYELKVDDTLLVPSNIEFTFDPAEDSVVVSIQMNPEHRSRVGF
uniref:3-hydroxyanthranilate 3,4-dioxygenase n=1 Tax=Lepeophtheirus salmonis TaxID=72036 RepID=D3PG97_LEPSM|nr:3-hydroxyanthranilate 3,4-dioxygenase [Lepeophtheirus salmonis]